MKMLVGESFTEASDKATQEVINPANGQVVDTVPSATQEDVKKAIDTAVEGQKEWAARTVRERTAVLKKFAAEVMARRLELGKILAVESGKRCV